MINSIFSKITGVQFFVMISGFIIRKRRLFEFLIIATILSPLLSETAYRESTERLLKLNCNSFVFRVGFSQNIINRFVFVAMIRVDDINQSKSFSEAISKNSAES